MSTPIIVLAGQSNASRLSGEIETALDSAYGQNNYTLIDAYSAGAPLTRARDLKDDWLTDGEMRTELSQDLIDALSNDPGSYVEGVLWIQGEADTTTRSDADDYYDLFNELFTEIKDSVAASFSRDTGITDMTIVISGLSDQAPEAENRANWDVVQDQQANLATNFAFIEVVDPDEATGNAGIASSDLFSDSLHYSDAASEVIADAMVDTLIETEPADDDGGYVSPKCDPDRMTSSSRTSGLGKSSNSDNVLNKITPTDTSADAEFAEDVFVFATETEQAQLNDQHINTSWQDIYSYQPTFSFYDYGNEIIELTPFFEFIGDAGTVLSETIFS